MILVATVRSDLVTQRTHSRIMRGAFRSAMEHHRNVTMAKHFQEVPETQPGGAYGYEKRTDEYNRRKQTYKGHTRPLSFSRRLEGVVRQQSKVTATQSRARMRARSYFKMPVQMRYELEAITPQEEQDIANMIGEHYEKGVNDPANRRKRAQKTGG